MCVLAPRMDHVLGRMSEKSGCGVSFGTVRSSLIFAETTEVLAGAVDLLSEEAKSLGLRVSWIKTKVQAFGASCMRPLSQFL